MKKFQTHNDLALWIASSLEALNAAVFADAISSLRGTPGTVGRCWCVSVFQILYYLPDDGVHSAAAYAIESLVVMLTGDHTAASFVVDDFLSE